MISGRAGALVESPLRSTEGAIARGEITVDGDIVCLGEGEDAAGVEVGDARLEIVGTGHDVDVVVAWVPWRDVGLVIGSVESPNFPAEYQVMQVFDVEVIVVHVLPELDEIGGGLVRKIVFVGLVELGEGAKEHRHASVLELIKGGGDGVDRTPEGALGGTVGRGEQEFAEAVSDEVRIAA